MLKLTANSSEQFISLNFTLMGTECSYDYVYVYDGDSFNSPVLGSFSGRTRPQTVVATSGFVSYPTSYFKCNSKLGCFVNRQSKL